MARKHVDEKIDRDTVLSNCADQIIALARKKNLTMDELSIVMRRTRKAAAENARV